MRRAALAHTNPTRPPPPTAKTAQDKGWCSASGAPIARAAQAVSSVAARPSEQLDPGSEHQSEEDERNTGGDREVERGRAGRRRARQARGEQPGDGEEPERENRIHAPNVRARLTRAQAAP